MGESPEIEDIPIEWYRAAETYLAGLKFSGKHDPWHDNQLIDAFLKGVDWASFNLET